MTNNVEHLKFENNGETFTRGTYNGISVIIHDKTGFINATEMCKQFNKKFRKIFENHAYQQYFAAFKQEYSARPEMGVQSDTEFLYQLNKGIGVSQNFLRGTYVDPRLINYIAIWASPQYAILVGKIMDSINEKIHNELTMKQLPDTPENTTPILNKEIKKFEERVKKQTELVNSTSCWGVRDSPNRYDAFEQQQLQDDVNTYIKARDTFNKAKDVLEKQRDFVELYHPKLEF